MCRNMDPTTETLAPPGGVAAFYDRLAPDYDAMTLPGKRFVKEKPFFRVLVEKYGVAEAVDAGCGTGFHSLLLAQLGVRVTAIDIADAMVRQTAAHAREAGLPVTCIRAALADLPAVVQAPVDGVFCMGNTLPHLTDPLELRRAIAAFAGVIRPGGILFTGMLNYERILAAQERVQSVRETGGVTFIRFYDFPGGEIRLNILRLDRRGEGIQPELISLPLAPLVQETLAPLLADEGFEEIRAFGSIAMEPFDPARSGDLVILAHRA